jgi:hypothetical protein
MTTAPRIIECCVMIMLTLEIAQKLSRRLRAAEERIVKLEAEAVSCQEQAERAEQWLHKVYTEIEDRFLHREHALRGAPQR